ncbi:MAG: hypothetical protein KAW09_07955, partial [Thermoplasmata archaeon]|nr:hypothetical protein [Thermoplasmata archaeon]
SGIADGPGDDLFIAHGNLVGQGWSGNAIGLEVARSFCHELGDTLHLGLSPGTHESTPTGCWNWMS